MKACSIPLPLAGLVFWVGCDPNPTGPSAPSAPTVTETPPASVDTPKATKKRSASGAIPASSLKD
jgi:hypothetical protein